MLMGTAVAGLVAAIFVAFYDRATARQALFLGFVALVAAVFFIPVFAEAGIA